MHQSPYRINFEGRGHRRPATVGSPALTKGGEEETPPLTPIVMYHILIFFA